MKTYHGDNEKQKRETTEGIKLLSQESIRTLGEKENYKYLGILKADAIKKEEMKEQTRKEYLSRTRISRNRFVIFLGSIL